MNKQIVWASALGASSILLGALGAHFLKETLSAEELNSFLTGVRYQMYGALYLLLLALLNDKLSIKRTFNIGLTGTLLFSGSIYLLVADSHLGISLSFLGPITPIGGILLITSWVFLGITGVRAKK